DPHTLTQAEIDMIAREARMSSSSGRSGPYLSPRRIDLLRAPVYWNDREEMISGTDVPAVGKRLTPIMLEQWLNHIQQTSGRPTSRLTTYNMADHNLKWGQEYKKMNILPAFYECRTPANKIGTASAGAKKASQDWYRSKPQSYPNRHDRYFQK